MTTTKVTGLGMTVTVADSSGTPRDISNDITDLSFSTPRGLQDVTGLDKSAIERLLLLCDGKVTIKGTFDPGTNKSHSVFSTVPTTSVNRATVITINSTPTATLTLNLLFSDYAVTRATDGKLTWQATGDNADGSIPTWS